jgi:hypothetical protein
VSTTYAQSRISKYRWSFVEPLSLRAVARSSRPISVVFGISQTTCVYVGVALVHSRHAKCFTSAVHWEPTNSGQVCGICTDGPISCRTFAGYAGWIISHNAFQPITNAGSIPSRY